jgi:hypothetical protein
MAADDLQANVASPVPEPASLTILCLGMLALIRKQRK